MTILKTFFVKKAGKKIKVEQAKGQNGKQDLFYIVNGKQMTGDQFFGMNLKKTA